MANADPPPVTLASVASAKFLETLEMLGFGVALLTADLRFLDVSPLLCDLLGRSVEEIRSLRDPASIVVPHHRHMVADRRRSLAEGEAEPRKDEAALLAADGELVPVEFSSTTLALGDGQVGLLSVCRDLRPSLAIDGRLTRLDSLAQLMPVGFIVWDAAGVADPMRMRLAAVNAGAARMLGVDLADRIGATVGELFPDANPLEAARLLALAGTGRVEDLGDSQYHAGLFRWRGAGLPGPAVGVLFEDVSHERTVERERRALLERLVDTGDDERRRLAVAMHDDPVQKIAAATLLVEALRRHPDTAMPADRLASIEATLRSAMATLRQLTFELSPPELVESGLEAAVRSAADYLFEGTAVRVDVEVDLSHEPPATVQTSAFRILAEALANARRHANAADVRVRVFDADGVLVIVVSDDGRGIETDAGQLPGHLGLRTMRERALSLGGTFEVRSASDGAVIEARLPLDGRVEPLPAADAPVLGTGSSIPEDSFRQERASLREALAAALDRAHLAESRMRESVGITKAMFAAGLSRDAIAGVAAERIGHTLRDGCAVHLLEAGQLRTISSWHADPSRAPLPRLFEVGEGGGHVGTVLRSGTPVVVDGPSLELAARDAGLAEKPPASAVIAPLRLDGAAFGVVTVTRDDPDAPFGDDDVDFLMCLVDCVAIALMEVTTPTPSADASRERRRRVQRS